MEEDHKLAQAQAWLFDFGCLGETGPGHTVGSTMLRIAFRSVSQLVIPLRCLRNYTGERHTQRFLGEASLELPAMLGNQLAISQGVAAHAIYVRIKQRKLAQRCNAN